MRIILILILLSFAFSQPYSELQQIINESSSVTFSIDISDDNQILVSGNYDNHAHIYRKSNNLFSHNQTTPISQDDVDVADITADGQYLLVIEWLALEVIIYKNLNDQFSEEFSLEPADGSVNMCAGAITDDHEWVVIATWTFQNVEVYNFQNQNYTLNQTFSVT